MLRPNRRVVDPVVQRLSERMPPKKHPFRSDDVKRHSGCLSGDVRGAHRRGENSPVRRVPGGTGADSVSVRRSVCRVGGASAMAVRERHTALTPGDRNHHGRLTPPNGPVRRRWKNSSRRSVQQPGGPCTGLRATAVSLAIRCDEAGEPPSLTYRASSIRTCTDTSYLNKMDQRSTVVPREQTCQRQFAGNVTPTGHDGVPFRKRRAYRLAAEQPWCPASGFLADASLSRPACRISTPRLPGWTFPSSSLPLKPPPSSGALGSPK